MIFEGRSDHGKTSWADDDSWQRSVEHVEGLVDASDVERFDLFGRSHCTDVASRSASLHPDKLTHLVLLDGGLGPSNPPERDDSLGRVFAAI